MYGIYMSSIFLHNCWHEKLNHNIFFLNQLFNSGENKDVVIKQIEIFILT